MRKTTIGLLPLLSPNADNKAIQTLNELRDPEKPDLMAAIIQAANRLGPEISASFNTEVYTTSKYPEVKA